jgi:hypothetical protein
MIGLGSLARAVIDGLLAQPKTDGITWLSWLNNWQKCSTLQEVSRGTGRQARSPNPSGRPAVCSSGAPFYSTRIWYCTCETTTEAAKRKRHPQEQR